MRPLIAEPTILVDDTGRRLRRGWS